MMLLLLRLRDFFAIISLDIWCKELSNIYILFIVTNLYLHPWHGLNQNVCHHFQFYSIRNVLLRHQIITKMLPMDGHQRKFLLSAVLLSFLLFFTWKSFQDVSFSFNISIYGCFLCAPLPTYSSFSSVKLSKTLQKLLLYYIIIDINIDIAKSIMCLAMLAQYGKGSLFTPFHAIY